jgi:hypothetical protein
VGGFMSSVVISGDTSGAITLAAPAVSGTNTATLPAATGTVMVSGNMPAFSAYSSAGTQSVSSVTNTKILIDTETFDTNNNFASNRFTPTVAGYYQINGCVYLSGTLMLYGSVRLFKNGSQYKVGSLIIPTTGTQTDCFSNVSDVVYMNGSTDYLELYAYTSYSGSIVIVGGSTALTYFSGCLVRTA